MKIGIDITSVETNPDGIGNYTINLMNALFKIDKENEYFIYSTHPFQTDKINIVIPRLKLFPFKGIAWMVKVANHAKKINLDLLITPSNYLLSLLFNKTCPIIFDLTPVYHPEFYTWKGAMMYKFAIKYMIPKAYKIIAMTGTVKEELAKYIHIQPNRIQIVYPSMNMKLIDEAIDFVKFDLPKKYILTVSTLSPKKNIPALLDGFKEYLNFSNDNETKLVIIGRKGWKFDAIFKKIKSLNLEEDVIIPGYVDDKYMASIYKNARAFVMLSKHEGFGMPILEALFFNTPVIASDIPVFKECFYNAVTYVDPNNKNRLAQTINEVLSNPPLNNFDITKYSWEKSAKDLLNIINS